MNIKQKPIKEYVEVPYRIKEDILPHISTPLHYHPHYELVWIKKGYGKRLVGDSQGNFEEGDMVLMYPDLPHVWENDEKFYQNNPDYVADVVVIHFTKDVIRTLVPIPELYSMGEILKMSKRGLLIQGETRDKISQIIDEIFISEGIRKVILFLRIFEEIINGNGEVKCLASDSFLFYFQELKSDHLKRIDEYISQNFKRKIKVKEIADMLCMSTSSFYRFFKDKTGMNFVDYLTDYRLRYAKSLLDSNKYKISTIAHMSGFSDVGYFNKIFKLSTNMTPSEYMMSIQL